MEAVSNNIRSPLFQLNSNIYNTLPCEITIRAPIKAEIAPITLFFVNLSKPKIPAISKIPIGAVEESFICKRQQKEKSYYPAPKSHSNWWNAIIKPPSNCKIASPNSAGEKSN